MNYIEKKIESLGGVDILRRRKSGKLRDKIIAAEKPPAFVVALIDQFGYAMFNKTIGCKTISKIPFAGKKWTDVEFIFGWGTDESGVAFHLENLKEEADGYFPFAQSYPGDMICVCTKGKNKGRIDYWSHEDGEFYAVSKSFKDFVTGWEEEKEKKGKKKKQPKLISFWIADDL